MNEIANIEFYNTPEGDVMMKELGRPAVVLDENNRPTIECMLSVIRDRYPKAHTRLMQIYSSSTMNRWYYEFRVVHRFIRCNFGEYDQHNLDINRDGLFVFEEVISGVCEKKLFTIDPYNYLRRCVRSYFCERKRERMALVGTPERRKGQITYDEILEML